MTLLSELELNIRAFTAQHGSPPTHIFVPASYDIPENLRRVGPTLVVELYDPTIKEILTAQCKIYNVNH